MITILVADDHPVVRMGIVGMLQSAEELNVVAEASDGEAALEILKERPVDVLLTDLRMPHMDGTELTREALSLPSPPRVVVLTTYDTDADILRAVEAGAVGYLLKDAPRDQIVEAVRAAASGYSSLSPRVAAALVQRVQKSDTEELTSREREVLRLVSEGQTNAQIGRSLQISLSTVKTHLEHCYEKLNVSDRAAAVAKVLSQGSLN